MKHLFEHKSLEYIYITYILRHSFFGEFKRSFIVAWSNFFCKTCKQVEVELHSLFKWKSLICIIYIGSVSQIHFTVLKHGFIAMLRTIDKSKLNHECLPPVGRTGGWSHSSTPLNRGSIKQGHTTFIFQLISKQKYTPEDCRKKLGNNYYYIVII